MIGGHTRVLCLLGFPVTHSLSPAMHNASFAALGLDYVYVGFDVAPERLEAAVRGAVDLGVRGFNATMPHKRALPPLLDEMSEAVRVAGAANTVVVEDGRLHGHVTDGTGLVAACAEAGVGLAGRRVLLLGAGGVSAPVAVAFDAAGIESLRVCNRTEARAVELVQTLRGAHLRAAVEAVPFARRDEEAAHADVIVNATALGMRDGDPLPLDAAALRPGAAVCDAVYRPGGETALIRAARAAGAPVVTGRRMLLYQGVEAQRLFTGVEPDVAAMSAALG
jgi:shikimate dehydrogenase